VAHLRARIVVPKAPTLYSPTASVSVNVLLDVALGAACDLVRTWRGVETVRELRDLSGTCFKFGDRVFLNGHPSERLPNTLNVSFVERVGPEILGAYLEWPRPPVRRAMPDPRNCPQYCAPWELHLRSEWVRFGSVSAAQRPGEIEAVVEDLSLRR